MSILKTWLPHFDINWHKRSYLHKNAHIKTMNSLHLRHTSKMKINNALIFASLLTFSTAQVPSINFLTLSRSKISKTSIRDIFRPMLITIKCWKSCWQNAKSTIPKIFACELFSTQATFLENKILKEFSLAHNSLNMWGLWFYDFLAFILEIKNLLTMKSSSKAHFESLFG